MKDESCEEILRLVNELIDGELEGKKLEEAQELLRNNPQCAAMFGTISQTINLYRLRCKETKEPSAPEFDWTSFKKDSS